MSTMPSQKLCVRVPDTLLQKFHSYLKQHDLTITEGMLAAMAAYVGDKDAMPLTERVRWLEQRLALLENRNSK